jgi:hypothetical protein
MSDSGPFEFSRRDLLKAGTASAAATALPLLADAQGAPDAPVINTVALNVNGKLQVLKLDTGGGRERGLQRHRRARAQLPHYAR